MSQEIVSITHRCHNLYYFPPGLFIAQQIVGGVSADCRAALVLIIFTFAFQATLKLDFLLRGSTNI